MASRSVRQQRQRQAAVEGRGGPRQGKPGTAYQNRTDLNTIPQTAPGQGYGVAAQQAADQHVVPMAKQPQFQAQPQAQVDQANQLGQQAQQAVALDAPTQRPNEALTSGIPTGPGPGPEALNNGAGSPDPVVAMLRGVYAQHPTADVLALLQEAQDRASKLGPPNPITGTR